MRPRATPSYTHLRSFAQRSMTSSLALNPGGGVLDEANNSEGSSETKSGEEPTASIQPVANEEPIPHIITGKSSEQVVEALKEVPLEGWAASKQKSDEVYAHEEL